MAERMTVGETYDELLQAWKSGIIVFHRESMIAVDTLKRGIPAKNIGLINSVLNRNERTAEYFKQLIEEIDFTEEGAAERVRKHVDGMMNSLAKDKEALATLKSINDAIVSKGPSNDDDDIKIFAIR